MRGIIVICRDGLIGNDVFAVYIIVNTIPYHTMPCHAIDGLSWVRSGAGLESILIHLERVLGMPSLLGENGEHRYFVKQNA